MQGLNRVAHNGGNASGWETLEKRCLTSLVVKDFARKPTWHRFRCTRHKLLSLRVDRGRREVDPTFAVKLPWLQGFSSRAQNVSRSSVCTSSKIQIQQCLLSILPFTAFFFLVRCTSKVIANAAIMSLWYKCHSRHTLFYQKPGPSFRVRKKLGWSAFNLGITLFKPVVTSEEGVWGGQYRSRGLRGTSYYK